MGKKAAKVTVVKGDPSSGLPLHKFDKKKKNRFKAISFKTLRLFFRPGDERESRTAIKQQQTFLTTGHLICIIILFSVEYLLWKCSLRLFFGAVISSLIFA